MLSYSTVKVNTIADRITRTAEMQLGTSSVAARRDRKKRISLDDGEALESSSSPLLSRSRRIPLRAKTAEILENEKEERVLGNHEKSESATVARRERGRTKQSDATANTF